MGRAWVRAFIVAFAASFCVVGTNPATAAEPGEVPDVREVRTTWTSEFGADSPAGLTYIPPRNELLVADPASASTAVVRLDRDEAARGTMQLPAVADPSTLAYDPAANQLTAVSNDEVVVVPNASAVAARPTVQRANVANLDLDDPRGATFDPAQGTWFVLDAQTPEIVSVDERGTTPGTPVHTSLAPELSGKTLRGLAFNPADGLLYVDSPDEDMVYGVDTTGTIAKSFSTESLDLRNPTAMTFAPSTDSTDAPATQNLFIADAGEAGHLGGVTEMTLAPAAALAAPIDSATLVQTINTSAFAPGSPDPSGVAYLPSTDRLEIADSEVEEVTGAGYHGVNLWQITRTGTVTDTGTTYPNVSKEPNGLGFAAGSSTLLISDDNLRRVHLMRPGNDTRYGTSDDVLTFIGTFQYGSDDTEDPTFDPVSGDIFFVDGVDAEVFRIDAGNNGVFGDADDVMTHFDVGQFGITDTEALEYYAPNDSLIVGNRTDKELVEVTKTGTLLRVIDLSGIAGLENVSGLTVAPASSGGGSTYWIVDRQVDNGPNPNENDGKLFEVRAGPTNNTPPVVNSAQITQTAPKTNDVLSVTVNATDANNDPLTLRYQWRKNGVQIAGATASTLNLAVPGNGDKADGISVRVTAFDGTIESNPVTTSQRIIVNSPPAFNQNLGNRTDAEGADVSISAAATDPDNDPLTYGATGLPAGVSIASSTGAISGTIADDASTSSPFSTSVTVREGTVPDATDTLTWTVTDTPPPPVPVITPGSATITEGNAGTQTVNVPVTLDQTSASTVTVQYETIAPAIPNVATAPSDYAATSGSVTFTPGQTSKTVPVTINGDSMREADETVVISFFNPTNATVSGSNGQATITNDDPLPVVAPGSTATVEGNTGTQLVTVPVTLDRASSSTVTVQYQTTEPAISNGAKAPGDYVTKSGTVTFEPGETSGSFLLTINADSIREGDEVVVVQFSNATNATMGGYFGLGFATIINDDPLPVVTPGMGSIVEGNSGTRSVTVPVTLDRASSSTVTVRYQTTEPAISNGAKAPGDYTAKSGSVTFAPGETAKTVSVTIRGDVIVEANEVVVISFSNPTNATVGGFYGLGFATITNDD